MNFLKNLILVGIALVVGVTSVKAVDDSTTAASATITSIVRGQIHLQSIEVINNGGSTVAVKLYDAPTNVLTYVVGAYTNWLTYTTNIVVTTTNYQGVVQTDTNLVTWTGPNAVGQATNSYKLLKTFSVAAGESATWTPASGVYLSFGLAATNNVTNTVYNYTYSTTR